MERACDSCGDPYEAKTKRSRFCSDRCRVANHAAGNPKPVASTSKAPLPVGSSKVGDALHRDLQTLGVHETYEGTIALGIARQLDGNVVVGAAYVSLSKELDRRVDALRLKAVRPDDPAAAAKASVREKRLRLAQ